MALLESWANVCYDSLHIGATPCYATIIGCIGVQSTVASPYWARALQHRRRRGMRPQSSHKNIRFRNSDQHALSRALVPVRSHRTRHLVCFNGRITAGEATHVHASYIWGRENDCFNVFPILCIFHIISNFLFPISVFLSGSS